MISLTTLGDVVAGAWSSIAENTTCALIAIGRSSSALNGSEVASGELVAARRHQRQFEMAVDLRPPVARHVLDHRRDAAGDEAVGVSAAERRDLVGRSRKRARADRRRHAFAGDVEDRRAIDGDPDLDEIGGDQARGQPGGARGCAVAAKRAAAG